ncbi:non-heme iron oxygenase ferredoxin subunit [Pigmentiphaga litoralis]|uniref:non-heme iron oxygenase ferredoxin subunit n=1 Tax=Pigmentiphaga litoralis TaxID=516702 RepID=UPI00389B1A61
MTAANWTPVAIYDEIPEDGTMLAQAHGVPVCLYKLEGQIFATDNRCSHGDADLSDGLVQDGCLIECPLHEGTFDIRTGKAIGAPCTEDIRTHDIRVEDGVVLLHLSGAPETS